MLCAIPLIVSIAFIPIVIFDYIDSDSHKLLMLVGSLTISMLWSISYIKAISKYYEYIRKQDEIIKELLGDLK